MDANTLIDANTNITNIFFSLRYTRKTGKNRKRNRKNEGASQCGNKKIQKKVHTSKVVKWEDQQSMCQNYEQSIQGISCLMKDLNEKQIKKINDFTKGFTSTDDDSDDTCLRHYNETISKKGFLSLTKGEWLQDDVLNFYAKLLEDRDNILLKSGLKRKRSIFMNTCYDVFLNGKQNVNSYIENKVSKNGLKNIFNASKMFVPINYINVHWMLVTVDIENEVIEGYNSISNEKHYSKYLNNMMHLIYNHLDTMYEDMNNSCLPQSWRIVDRSKKIPQQKNGSDCGVFVLAFIDFLSVGDEWDFDPKEENTTKFRKRLQLSIINKNCLM